MNKFIKLSVDIPGDEELVNPIFITRIRKAGVKTIVYTMDGSSIYTNDTVQDVMKKIKDTEKFILDTNVKP
jgi:uncharacterized protein YlzI (FlbEa/FlbD family)